MKCMSENSNEDVFSIPKFKGANPFSGHGSWLFLVYAQKFIAIDEPPRLRLTGEVQILSP